MTYGHGVKLDEQAVTVAVALSVDGNKPCPFCGCTDILIVHHRSWVKASCDDCGASTGAAFNEPVALNLWNSRIVFDNWKEMSVTEIAGYNKSVYEYIKQLEDDAAKEQLVKQNLMYLVARLIHTYRYNPNHVSKLASSAMEFIKKEGFASQILRDEKYE